LTYHIISYVRMSVISKMAARNRKCIWNNVYLSLYTCQQRNSNNYAYVLGSSNITALIRRKSQLIGRHLWYATHPHTGEFDTSPVMLVDLENSCWNFISIMHKSWDLLFSYLTSEYRPLILIYHLPWRRRVIILFLTCIFLDLNNGSCRWKFADISFVSCILVKSGLCRHFEFVWAWLIIYDA